MTSSILMLSACAVVGFPLCAAAGAQSSSSGPTEQGAPPRAISSTTDALAAPPPGYVTSHRIPSPEEVQAAQGPQFKPAPEIYVPDRGFPAAPTAQGNFSISQHDSEKLRDETSAIAHDATTRRITGSDPPSVQATANGALASGTRQLGKTTGNEFLEKTVPEAVMEEWFSAAETGAGLVLDSEPTAGRDLDYPNDMRRTQSALQNVSEVLSGGGSAFGDANTIQACNRLQATYAQTQFNLTASQQRVVQQFLDLCSSAPSRPIQPPPPASRGVPVKAQPSPARPPCVVGCNK